MKTIITSLLISLFTTSLYAADAYLCITEISSGISFNKSLNKWEPIIFQSGEKLLLKRSKKKGFKWRASLHKDKNFWSLCRTDFNKYNTISCDGFFNFIMNKKNMKFKAFNIEGYTESSQFANRFNLYISIGKCSEI